MKRFKEIFSSISKTARINKNIQNLHEINLINSSLHLWEKRKDSRTRGVTFVNLDTKEIRNDLIFPQFICPRWKRVVAGGIDLLCASRWGVGFELGDFLVGNVSGQLFFLVIFCLRDCTFDRKTRSLGKKLLKLEVVSKDLTIASKVQNVCKNLHYWLCNSLMIMALPIFPLIVVSIDILPFLFTKNHRRLADIMGQCYVITEQPNYLSRVEEVVQAKKDKRESEDLELLNLFPQIKQVDDNKKLNYMFSFHNFC